MKAVLFLIVCCCFFGCARNKVLLTWQSAPGTPKAWLQKGFNDKPFKNTLNFYITNNAWSGKYERALSVSDSAAYLVVVVPGDPYLFEFHEVEFSDCPEIGQAKEKLDYKIKIYSDNPAFAKEEAIYWLDGPDYFLEKYGEQVNNVIYSKSHELYGFGNLVQLSEKMLLVTEKCTTS